MYDVFFLSYDESFAERNWKDLKTIVSRATRLHGIDGILSAHTECARLSKTSHFFVVDGDSEILEPSVFDFKVSEWDSIYVHLWFAKASLLKTPYGWGGIKLFPKSVFDNANVGVDMTTSFPLKVIPEIKSITHFNTSPLETWRSAFREAAKLTVKEDSRIEEWLNPRFGAYSAYCKLGAKMGQEYALSHDITKINDYRWLKEQFNSVTED